MLTDEDLELEEVLASFREWRDAMQRRFGFSQTLLDVLVANECEIEIQHTSAKAELEH